VGGVPAGSTSGRGRGGVCRCGGRGASRVALGFCDALADPGAMSRHRSGRPGNLISDDHRLIRTGNCTWDNTSSMLSSATHRAMAAPHDRSGTERIGGHSGPCIVYTRAIMAALWAVVSAALTSQSEHVLTRTITNSIKRTVASAALRRQRAHVLRDVPETAHDLARHKLAPARPKRVAQRVRPARTGAIHPDRAHSEGARADDVERIAVAPFRQRTRRQGAMVGLRTR
jgi:hypothetical protein